MANVQDVIDFILDWARDSGELITNMWLQKLLYFAQGQYLARTGNKLFSDRIEAWQFGPVVPSVYNKYKIYGTNPIQNNGEGAGVKLTAIENDILYDVLRKYGVYNASELVRQSHNTDPWKNSYTGEMHQEITASAMQSYFSQSSNIVLSFDEILTLAKIPVYDIRNDDGIIILPADDDAREYEDAI